ncbi:MULTISPECIES: FAD-dependent oxidoreductase [Ramlibacter]|uniref:FAD-dependent oxidoreductase n=1 Tax=Ramlibacter pinisoli TaxID=2682844 RepID=A0A6N8INJ8_9BURK|nr:MULTISPECIES: FAD-dependent oxidoreductase [Ramlibacter]MBA2963295.1 FAD-dependent oxidoreductase [Ramlibacter sp. CGMCC 1.13660]MVQ28262.1 FAD-dependent oxidoreductase [Ramlibacter pinisoli]
MTTTRTLTLTEPSRQTPIYGEYDVVVLGGGPAGIAAAVSAARAGRSTLLVERYGFLGGMGTAAGVTNFCGLHANVHGDIRRVVHGVASELLERIDRLGGLNTPHALFGKTVAQAYDTAAYKIAADELMASAGVHLLFHALGAGVLMDAPGRIGALLVETKSGRRAIVGRAFVDGSGDGDLAAWAGAPWDAGDGAGNFLYPSTMFRLNDIDPERAGNAWEVIPRLMLQAQAEGRYHFPRKTPIVRPQKSGIEWRVNLTQLANVDGNAMDGTDADELSQAEVLGRRQIASVAGFLREVPGFERAYIVDIAPQVGIRETRRVRGHYQLTESDVLDCASFPDTIGVNGWPLELHLKGDVEFRWPKIPESRGFNHLPYRMIVPLGVDNLWVAGRCASMTHEAQSAARVTGACFVMGEAAGAAAHLALEEDGRAAGVDTGALQARLEAQGAWLGRED